MNLANTTNILAGTGGGLLTSHLELLRLFGGILGVKEEFTAEGA